MSENDNVRRFYVTKDTFNFVPIPVTFGAKSGAGPVERVLEVVCLVSEKRHVRDPLVLTELTKEQQGELRLSRLKQPSMENW